mgnify:FL=1
MDRLCIVIPIWQRATLTNHLLTYYHTLQVPGVELCVVAVGSEGRRSRLLARGLEYVETENRPLDRKFDVGFEYCRSFEPDAVCLIGSDDFVTEPYFSWAMRRIRSDVDLAGLLDLYLVALPQQRVFYWSGYEGARAGESIGSARVYSKRILDEVDWRPYTGFGECSDFVRDDQRAHSRICRCGGLVENICMANLGCQFWAVKTGAEWNPIVAFETHYRMPDITQHAWRQFQLSAALDPVDDASGTAYGTWREAALLGAHDDGGNR